MKKKLLDFVSSRLNKWFVICPKTGKIVSLRMSNRTAFLLFPITGLLAIVWFIVRTIPKPSRAMYPCQKIAAGIGVSFLTFFAGAIASFALFKKLKGFFKNSARPAVTATFICLSVCLGFVTMITMDSLITDPPRVYADWNPTDAANTPIGTAQGIYPGRVTWAHNPDATANTPSGSWWQSGNTNQTVVNTMCADSIKSLTGTTDVASAWDALFRNYNQKKGKGNVGYASGETIVIKINTVNTNAQTKYGTAIDATAETVLAIVEQLVAQAGVPQTNVIVYDGGVGTIGSYVYDCVSRVYPNVQFQANVSWGNVKPIQWVSNGITYSSMNITNAEARMVAKCLWDSAYLINLALLKKHENQTAITLCGKNHFGSVKTCSYLHASINDQTKGMSTYNSLVDLLGHQRIGAKTVLFVIDGLWGAAAISGNPVRWQTAPFSNDWPSSLFMSQDGVAIDSVGLDFINSEQTLWDNADNYLHEAAQANNPPSGVAYDPEADGSRLTSLGAHEHWNNAQSKQYTRNLGSGSGIELVVAGQTQPEQTPVPTTVTTTVAPTAAPGSLGDANGNGSIDIVDALLVAQYYVGSNPQNFIAANADVNKDGTITIVDALQIARCYVGIIACTF